MHVRKLMSCSREHTLTSRMECVTQGVHHTAHHTTPPAAVACVICDNTTIQPHVAHPFCATHACEGAFRTRPVSSDREADREAVQGGAVHDQGFAPIAFTSRRDAKHKGQGLATACYLRHGVAVAHCLFLQKCRWVEDWRETLKLICLRQCVVHPKMP